MHRTTKAYLIACGLFFVFITKAQNQVKADSIRVLINERSLSTNEKLEAYYWLSVYSSSPDQELNYGTLLLQLARKSDNQEYVIKANLRIGVAHRLLGNLGQALEYLFEGANNASESSAFTSLLVDIYQEISTCYTQNGDSDNALLYGSKTIDLLRKTGNKQRLALTLLNTGYDYYVINKYDSAMSYYNESEPILQEIGMTIGLAYIIGNRALVFWKKGDTEKAKKDLYRAIEMLEPLADQYGMADYYNQLGNIYLDEGDHNQAIIHTKKGLEMALDEGLKEQIRDASNLLFLLYQRIGDYQKAIGYQSQYYAYKDSIQNLETTQQLANLRTAFEVGQKQAEVDLLLEQKKGNQIIMLTGGVILIIFICLSIFIYFYSKSKVKLSRQLEEQKDTLVALNNTKDKFFSIISHDLRGPVHNLSALIGITRNFLNDGNTSQLKEMLDKMETSKNHLVKLLDNLLQWALQQRGHFNYSPENIGVKGLLLEVADMCMDMANSKNINLDFKLDDNLKLFIDKNTTSTVFRNLLSNAIKFTPDGGHVEILVEKNKKSGIIKFVDNGVGISKDKLEILFNLNSSITTKGTSGESGLGLGLQLVYDFVQFNKGKIEVESEEGIGTTFTVHLPLHDS